MNARIRALKESLNAAERAVATATDELNRVKAKERRKVIDRERRLAEVTQTRNSLRDALAKANWSSALDLIEPTAGTIIKFRVQHNPGGPVYQYAALRVLGRWYTTGSSCPRSGYTWGQIIDLMKSSNVDPKPVQVASWKGLYSYAPSLDSLDYRYDVKD